MCGHVALGISPFDEFAVHSDMAIELIEGDGTIIPSYRGFAGCRRRCRRGARCRSLRGGWSSNVTGYVGNPVNQASRETTRDEEVALERPVRSSNTGTR